MKNFLLSLVNHHKVGGLHFVRFGQFSVSFCISKKHASILEAAFAPVDMSQEILLTTQFFALL